MSFLPTLPKSLGGSTLILISALMFGSYGVFSKYLGSYDIFFQTYVRCLIVAVILFAYGLYTKQLKKIEKEDYGWFAVVLVFTSFSIAPMLYAFRYLSLGTVSFLFYSSLTIFTYIFGFLFFGEKFTKVKIVSLALSFLGMLVIFAVNLSAYLLLPALMALFNGLASSGEVTFSKKISSKYSSTQITMLVFAVIAFSHFFISFLLGENQDTRLLTESLPTLILFVLAAIVGMITIVEGFKVVEPSIGAIVGLMEIVFSAVFGIIFFGEILSSNIIFGGFLIIVAAALPNLAQLKASLSSKN